MGDLFRNALITLHGSYQGTLGEEGPKVV
jgi:hypothetical protein